MARPDDLGAAAAAVPILCRTSPRTSASRPTAQAAAGGEAAPAQAARADAGLTVGEALRTPAFWIIALSFATFSMLVTGLFFHQVAIYDNRGISPQMAARLFSVSALTMVLAMPVFGRMLDRLPTRPMFAWRCSR